MASQMYGLAIKDQRGRQSPSSDENGSEEDPSCLNGQAHFPPSSNNQHSESHECGSQDGSRSQHVMTSSSACTSYDCSTHEGIQSQPLVSSTSLLYENRSQYGDSYIPNEFGARVGPPLMGNSYRPPPWEDPYGKTYCQQSSNNSHRESREYGVQAGRHSGPLVSASSEYSSGVRPGPPGHPSPLLVSSSGQQGGNRSQYSDSYIPNEFGARVGPPLMGHSYSPHQAVGSFPPRTLPDILYNVTSPARSLYASSHQSSATTVTFSTATSTIAYRPQ